MGGPTETVVTRTTSAAVRPVRWGFLPRYGQEAVRLLNVAAVRLPTWPPPGPEARDRIASILAETVGGKTPEAIRIEADRLEGSTFGDFLLAARAGILATLRLGGEGERGLVWIESELAHRVIDRVLGGPGVAPPDLRGLTGVESGILSYVLLRILRGLHVLGGAEPGSVARLTGVLEEGQDARDLVPTDGPCLTVVTRVALGDWSGEVRTALPERALDLLGRGERPPPDRMPEGLAEASLLLRAEVGYTELTADDLGRLEPGDVLVPEQLHVAPREEGLVGACLLRPGSGGQGGVRARVRVEEGRIVAEVTDFLVDGLSERGATEESPMDENAEVPDLEPEEALEAGEAEADEIAEDVAPVEPAALPEGTPGEAAAMVRDIPLTVSIEMGRLRLSVGEVSALTPGQILEMKRAPHAPVDLVVGGRVVARGDLIEIQGELGVRIAEIAG